MRARHMQREAAVLDHVFPQRATRVDLEIDEARVEWNLARRHRQGLQRDARQVRADEFGQPVAGPDLATCRKLARQLIGRNVRSDSEHQA